MDVKIFLYQGVTVFYLVFKTEYNIIYVPVDRFEFDRLSFIGVPFEPTKTFF